MGEARSHGALLYIALFYTCVCVCVYVYIYMYIYIYIYIYMYMYIDRHTNVYMMM